LRSLLQFAKAYFETDGDQSWPFDAGMPNDLVLAQES